MGDPLSAKGRALPRFSIVRYHGNRDADVAALILSVQRDDVGLHVPIEEQPELLDIGGAYRDGAFWVATDGDRVIGTIGMMVYGRSSVLKKLFVDDRYRGRDGAGHALYDVALAWAVTQRCDAIFLDTPAVATRSHDFYRRRGFTVVDRQQLPAGYSFPDRDSLIFKLDLGGY